MGASPAGEPSAPDVLSPSFVAELRRIVGDAQVITDPDRRSSYERDWTGRFVGATPAVVRPGSALEIQGLVELCREGGVAIVTQGGNTGLVGGGVPLAGEVVLSTRRLNSLGAVDERARQVTVGAGATLAAVHDEAASVGLRYAVDLGARDSATIGGTVATNAGGVHVLRHGPTRMQLAGVEAVLGTGALVSHLGGLEKDNTGYDLAQLLCGSEGTLGIVTAARLRLISAPPAGVTALVGFADPDVAVDAVAQLIREVPELEVAELFLDDGLELVCTTIGLARPFQQHWPVYVLLEAVGRHDPTAVLAAALEPLVGDDAVAVATDDARRADLLRYREEHTPVINTLGPPHKLDVTLPLTGLAAFVDDVPAAVRSVAPDARTWLFGHVGDGNIHVNVTGVAPEDERVDDAVLHLVAERGGSISAEHGIGTAKRRWLSLARSPAELSTFAAIKRALDPDGILNPHVLVEV